MKDVHLVSRNVLLENQHLTQELEEVNHKLKIKNVQLYNLETRLENLDIFEQHMTSLNLRCEFLDRQISNLEQQKFHSIDNAKIFTRFNDFNFKMEWRTTETTLENLCTEFKYLKEQLDQANEQISLDTSFNDDSMLSNQSKVNSIFSENESCSTEESKSLMEPECINSCLVESKPIKKTSSTNRKKLLKMESFLNFKDTRSNPATSNPNSGMQLKGFKISNTAESPFYEANSTFLEPSPAPTKNSRKKLKLVDLPAITEEYSFDETVSNNSGTIQGESNFEKSSNSLKGHHRHLSLPDTSSLEDNNIRLTPKEFLKHFISDDVNLRSRYQNSDYKITDFLFEINSKSNHVSSSPQFSSFKDSYIDESEENSIYHEHNLSNPQIDFNQFDMESSDGDESYGSENATPLILRKQSKPILYRAQSHESVLTVMSRSNRNPPLQDIEFDLKAQTMKWLKPNNPVVSSTTLSQTSITDVSSSVNRTAHDNIMNLLNSGGTTTIESTPIKQTKSFTSSHRHSSSWIPTKIFASPIPVPKKEVEEAKPSWISSFILGSGFSIPEEDSKNNCNIRSSDLVDTPKAYQFPKREITTKFTGPSSALLIQKNGNKMIRHGHPSSYNDTAVISSRISYGALREALQQDLI